MLDLGWTEMLVIAIVLIVVVGPKDLPKMLRTFGKSTAKMRSMAGDFRKQFDEAMKEAELDDVKSTIDSMRKLNPTADIKKALNPMEKAAADIRSGIEQALKPTPSVTPAPAIHASEPLKTGPAAMPGEAPAAVAAPTAKAIPAKAAPVTAAKKTPATKPAAKAAPAAPPAKAAPAAKKPAAPKKKATGNAT